MQQFSGNENKETIMTTFQHGYYQADCINGITFVGATLEDSTIEVSAPRFFADYLDGLDQGETITTFFDESSKSIFEELNEKYSVKA
jgi:hypothetical protein